MRERTVVRAILLISLLAAPTVSFTDVMPISGVAAENLVNFSAKIDNRGFIDVRQLRHDVALLEPLKAKDRGEEACDSRQEYEDEEGDADLSTLSQEELKRREMAAARIQQEMANEAIRVRECVTAMSEAHQAYMNAFQAFNAAWLPALIEAMHRGDLIAEVILRQCSTTPVIDRSNIESTCTSDPARKKIAVVRLKEIGFAPAFELMEEPGYWEFGPGISHSTKGRLALQEIVLGAIAEGNLGNIPSDATGCLLEEPDFTHNNRLIEESLFRVRHAFTFSWRRDETDFLKLVRQPIRSKELTWGPATLATLSDRIFLTSIFVRADRFHYAGGLTPNAMRALDPCWGMGLNFSDTNSEVISLVKAEQANIDRYLKQDPRWGVFLMKRIGHHEWLPYDMEPEPTKLGSEWMGHWVLENSYKDFVRSTEESEGADIYLDGITPRISIKSNVHKDSWPNDTSGCTLRDSGGGTLQGIPHSISNSVLGNLDNIVTSPSVGDLSKEAKWINKETGLVNGLEPFEEKQSYRQILMQCENGESTGSEVVRFLLLGKATLVEVSVPYLRGAPVYVRHFKRAVSSGELQGFIKRSAPILEYLKSNALSLFIAIAMLVCIVCVIVLAWAKRRRR